MVIDKLNPKFQEYTVKFNQIVSNQEKELNLIEPTKGKDGHFSVITKKYALKIKELQNEYSFLFSEE